MSKLYPNEPPENSPKSERKVRACLAAVEHEDLVILHSVAWQSRRNGRQADGEADFVLLLPKRGILILEVKGGGIEIVEGNWYSTGGDGIRNRIKNPFDQAKDSKYALLSYLKACDPSFGRIPVVHGVVFPDIVVHGTLGLNAPREIVIDREDLDAPATTLERVFNHWEKSYPLSLGEIDRLVACLAPTTKVRRLLRDDVADTERTLIELTREQVRVLQSLKRIKKAAVFGGAGTGKTVLATEKARQLSQAGLRTLLVCYNAPLKRHLAACLKDSDVDVQTFHTLSVREARKAKIETPFEPTESWYESEAPAVMQSAINANGTRYDAVLVDEAQDFAEAWVASSLCLLSDENALFYLFADSHQDLYRRGWKIPDGLFEYELTVNCRNARPIAKRVARVFGDDIEDNAAAYGPEPKFVEAGRQEQIVPYVARLVEGLLLEEKLSPSQIVVLTDAVGVVSDLRRMVVADCLFTTLDGRGIPVETVFRFKGLERDVVVLALTDGACSLRETKPIVYVGLSRAKVGLYVVGSPTVRNAIGWDS